MNSFQKKCILLSGILAFSIIDVPYVSAISATSKPLRPEIVSVLTAKGSSKNKVNVLVNFTKATTSKRWPLILTEVRIGNYTCTAKKSATKCTIKNIPSGRIFAVSARAKNKMGFGKPSSKFNFKVFIGASWTSTPGDSTPGSSTPGSNTAIRFNLKNAIGIALKSSVSSSSVRKSSTGSNIQVVDASGSTSDAVVSGTASIKNILIAPNNKLYVVFNSRTSLGDVSCLLAQVDRQTGEPLCIDSSLTSIQWKSSGGGARIPTDPIQFDGSGAIYYVGTTASSTVLRKYENGTTTDLVNDNINLFSFLVRVDGSVFAYGQTKTSLSAWVRRFAPSGAITNLSTGSMAISMYEMPDNHIWLGLWNSEFGIRRFSLTSGTMVPGYWLSSTQTPSETDGQNLSFCVGGNINRAFCGWDGTHLQNVYRVSSGQVFAVAGTGSDGILMRFYPSFTKATTIVSKILVSQQVLNYVILSGLNSANQNVTTLYNTETDSEQTLVTASNEIEMYHLNYVASSNKIMFDGLRFSDNKYVIGQIDLNTGQVNSSQTGSSKLVDFQTFGS